MTRHRDVMARFHGAELDPPATEAELAWRRQRTRAIVGKSIAKTLGLAAVFGAGIAVRHVFRIGVPATFGAFIAPIMGGTLILWLTVMQLRAALKNARSIQAKRALDREEELNKEFLDALEEP